MIYEQDNGSVHSQELGLILYIVQFLASAAKPQKLSLMLALCIFFRCTDKAAGKGKSSITHSYCYIPSRKSGLSHKGSQASVGSSFKERSVA